MSTENQGDDMNDDALRGVIQDAANAGNWQAAAWLLENPEPEAHPDGVHINWHEVTYASEWEPGTPELVTWLVVFALCVGAFGIACYGILQPLAN